MSKAQTTPIKPSPTTFDDAKLKELARKGVLQQAAHSSLGIYCKSTMQADGTVKERDQYGEGWNAAVMAHVHNWVLVEKWFSTVPDEFKDMVLWLMENERLHVYIRGENCHGGINCNDLWAWACAEFEDITFEDLPELKMCLTLSEKYGDILWACRKIGMRPQKPYYKHFSDEEAALFNAAGPEKE
jgi:hypothetical protein